MGLSNYPPAVTNETPFNLVYGSEAVLSAEIGRTSAWAEAYSERNLEVKAHELDFVEKRKERFIIQLEAYRGQVMQAYKSESDLDFQVGGLVIKKTNPVGDVGKLEAR